MALRVHALGVSVVVATLRAIGGTFRCAGAHQRARCQPDTGTYACATATAESSAGCSAHYGTDCCAFNPTIDSGLIGGGSANLRAGKLPALEFVGAKLIEGFTGAGQHHHAGPGRHSYARA